MKNVKLNKCIIVFLIILFCTPLYYLVNHYYDNYILVQNVFDHMYYAKAYNDIISEEEQRELDYSRRVYSYGFTTRKSFCDSASYYEKYLNSPFDLPNQDIIIRIASPLEPILELEDYDVSKYGGMTINFETTFEATDNAPYEDIVAIGYHYDIGNKTLENVFFIVREYIDKNIEVDYYAFRDEEDVKQILNERGITEEDISEIREWLLYDKVLTDWFDANEGNTRFSIDDLGNVNFIE